MTGTTFFSYKTIQIIRFGPLFSRETLRNKFKFKDFPLDCPVFRLLKKMVHSFFKTTNPVILREAARRSRRIHRLQVGKVLDSATSGINAFRAE
jgi:hypothetical protein